MSQYNDYYGVSKLKEEKLEKERAEMKDILMKEISKELKSINERLEKIEAIIGK